MINIQKEELLTLADATKLCPRRRRGKQPHPSSLYRWARDGVDGVRLEILRVGNTTCTSAAALQRFFESITAHRFSVGEVLAPAVQSDVEEQLDALGL